MFRNWRAGTMPRLLAVFICLVGVFKGLSLVQADLLWGVLVASLLYGYGLWREARLGETRPTPGLSRGVLWAYWLCFAFLAPILGLRQMFGEITIPAILVHFQLGVRGTPSGSMVLTLLAGVLLWAIPAHALQRFLSGVRHGRVMLGTAVLGLLLINPFVTYAFQRTFGAFLFDEGELAEFYHPPEILAEPKRRLNLVIIYLEGLERTYGQNEKFGSAYDPIKRIGARGLVFKGIGQIAMTQYSIAGLTASLCGVPLFPQGVARPNSRPDHGNFLPGATCLGDVLAKRGYSQSFFVNSDPAFAGTDLLFGNHGFNTVVGLPDLKDRANGELNEWGVYDDTVFDAAWDRVQELANRDTPFTVIVETMGPHGPNGYLAPECRLPGQRGETKDILPAVRCTADLALKFVDQLFRLINQDDLLVVVVSDHLAHPFVSATKDLQTMSRENTAIVLGAGIEPGDRVKTGSMIDVFPTILELMGFEIRGGRANLGQSLLDDRPTLVGKLGVEATDQALNYDYLIRRQVWLPPAVEDAGQ